MKKKRKKRLHQKLGELYAELMKKRFTEYIKQSKKLYSRKQKHKHRED